MNTTTSETAAAAVTHTPGPWGLCHRGDYSDFGGFSQIILGPDNTRRIAAVHSSDAETEANARLIAAAPELLRALDKLCDDCEQAAYHLTRHGERTRAEALDERIEQARAVIAKAMKGGAS